MSDINFQQGDKLRLTVREPNGQDDARAVRKNNYRPIQYTGAVESPPTQKGTVTVMEVRWFLPASLGYDTFTGTTSKLIHVHGQVWLETRKTPRNVTAVLEKITEEEFRKLVEEAAGISLSRVEI